MKICILVPTFKRNAELLRLLEQLASLRARYKGPASFDVCVTDSNDANPQASILRARCDTYLINPSEGFDDNMLSAYSKLLPKYDYLFSISDDDMLSRGVINPLDIIEVSTRSECDAMLFEHYEFAGSQFSPAPATLKSSPYPGPAFFEAGSPHMTRLMMGYIPRHAGLLYRSDFVLRNLEKMNCFRDSLHLYAVPFHLALASGTANFVGYPLVYFNSDAKDTGAWDDHRKVFDGILHYLLAAKKQLSPEQHSEMTNGFMRWYLGEKGAARQYIKADLPSEEQVLQMLAAT